MKNQLGWRITKQKLLYFKEQFTIRPDMFHKPLSIHFNEICTPMALCVQSLIVSVREIKIMDFTWVITYAIYLIILRLITLFCQQDAPHENVKGLNQLVVIMWVTCELFFHIICSYGLVLITVLFVRFAFLLSFKGVYWYCVLLAVPRCPPPRDPPPPVPTSLPPPARDKTSGRPRLPPRPPTSPRNASPATSSYPMSAEENQILGMSHFMRNK